MRMTLLKIVAVLLLAGSGDARPQNGDTQTSMERATTEASGRSTRLLEKTIDDVRSNSSIQLDNAQRHLKDLQHIDQSLRTVATQLLNVTSHDRVIKDNEKDVATINTEKKTSELNYVEKNKITPAKEINSEITNLESMGMSYGRPINSKFAYFESSHPGQAMAMTEEELEKEMASTRLMTAYKIKPTTTGGISTWILLNPPSTTARAIEDDKQSTKKAEADVRYTLKPIVTHGKIEVKNSKNEQKVSTNSLTTLQVENMTLPSTKKSNSGASAKTTATSGKTGTTPTLQKLETIENTTLKPSRTTTAANSVSKNTVPMSSTMSGTTVKKPQITKTTLKPTLTTLRAAINSTTIKISRPNHQTKPKSSVTRRTTTKPENSKNENTSTAKIEKVTFKPMQMITTTKPKVESIERPMFVTKIKTSVLTDGNKTTTSLPITTSVNVTVTSKPNDLIELPIKLKPSGSKVNNVLNLQLKKPLNDTIKIEVEPIKISTPSLKIEKIVKNKIKEDQDDETLDGEESSFDNSRIDLKFDFNPELTKINVETAESPSSTTATTPLRNTTKRQRNPNKRKKNKVRRRKPTNSTVLTTPLATASAYISTTIDETFNEMSTESMIQDNAIQESKIAPETKITSNVTKTKKKPPQKGISTQIYNFLSREVMPSFGVMSLVGLGIGLASYFLYPFGGVIARRNYEVEPNYKYNLDEYGGNYGQSEEEVLSKVFQGMTNRENKFTDGGLVKDYDNYYHYQNYDGTYNAQTTGRTEQRYPLVSSSPVYRPAEDTATILKYRNTDYRYMDGPTTPRYYDRQKSSELAAAAVQSVSGNRQFVVGNVPKEYPPFTDTISTLSTVNNKGVNIYQEATESDQTQLFERNAAQTFNFPPSSVGGLGYQPEAETPRTDDGYEEIEITPTAVAVEHGPRALKVERSLPDKLQPSSRFFASKLHRSSRSKRSPMNASRPGARLLEGSRIKERRSTRRRRDSVIQIIPTKRELEEEQKEEDLSNEILNIIDFALPHRRNENNKDKSEDNEIDAVQSKKHRDKLDKDVDKNVEETSSGTHHISATSPHNSQEATGKSPESNDGSTSSTTDSILSESSTTDTMESDTKRTTVEWFDDTTTKKPDDHEEGFNIFNFVKKVAEIKFRLGLTILKHASEGFARYIGHVQKRINGEE